jgi:hypothetical protein
MRRSSVAADTETTTAATQRYRLPSVTYGLYAGRQRLAERTSSRSRHQKSRAVPSRARRIDLSPVRALVYTGPGRVEIQEVAKPTVGPGDVLLEIQAAAICGSDIHGFLGHSERRKPGLVWGTRPSPPSRRSTPP